MYVRAFFRLDRTVGILIVQKSVQQMGRIDCLKTLIMYMQQTQLIQQLTVKLKNCTSSRYAIVK